MASSRTKGRGKNSAMLARRKAALERAAERVAGQRRAAEAAEAERLRREAQFDELVADFELAVEDEAAAAAVVEEEVRRVRERGQVQIDAAKAAAARVVLVMGEAGETVAGCGLRLGVGVEKVKELRRLGRGAVAAEGAVVERTAAVQRELADGSVGEQRLDGGGGGGQVAGRPRGAGAAPVAAPPVTAGGAGPSA
ncbi:hypothetical protein [Streptomyces sp. NPDC059783]|uniref:hypothetical protein n=1 Tax=Streptomyces sp. NPDC059783 TaxID=3346944 RepID=UPI003655DA65